MSDTGRHFIKVDGRTFCVEPIDNTQGKSKRRFGDINPATKKVEGNYGSKHIGSIHEDDSIITKENGFKNIKTVSVGESPYDYIRKLLKDEN